MPTVEKKNGRLIIGGIAIALASALIGGAVGYNLKPVAKTDDLIVTEDVSGKKDELAGNTGSGDAAGPVKAYTQITDILDNARHVVEERFYAPDGSIVACEDGYAEYSGAPKAPVRRYGKHLSGTRKAVHHVFCNLCA